MFVNFSFRCTDRIRIFQNLDRPEVNEDSRWDEEICGNISDLEEKKFYSKDRGLILEFHTEHSRESHKGFKGVFTFLEKSKYLGFKINVVKFKKFYTQKKCGSNDKISYIVGIQKIETFQ